MSRTDKEKRKLIKYHCNKPKGGKTPFLISNFKFKNMSKVKEEDYIKMLDIIGECIDCFSIVIKKYGIIPNEFYYLCDDAGCGISAIDVVNKLTEKGITATVEVESLKLNSEYSEVLVTLV